MKRHWNTQTSVRTECKEHRKLLPAEYPRIGCVDRERSEAVYDEVGLYTTHGGRGEANLLHGLISRYFRHL